MIQCLQSVIESARLLPKYVTCNIEISDNSENEDIAKYLEKQHPKISVTLRRPNITVINHFKCVVREASTDYLVMFHDDDLMKPRFLPALHTLLISNPDAAAVGCNAFYMRNNSDISSSFMKRNGATITVDTMDKLLNGYFLIGDRGTSPFPGYMYRVKYINDACLDEAKGGIHADLSFLLDIVQRRSIILTSEILMSYRLHQTNVNNETSVPIQRSLLRYLKGKVCIKESRALQDFRYTIMLRWFKEQQINKVSYWKWSRRQRIVFKHIIYELVAHLVRPECRALHFQVMRDKFLGQIFPKLRDGGRS